MTHVTELELNTRAFAPPFVHIPFIPVGRTKECQECAKIFLQVGSSAVRFKKVPLTTESKISLRSRSRSPAIKRSALQTVDGGPFKGKRLQKMKPSSFGLIAVFLRHAPDSQLFHDNTFERLRCFLNSLDLSVCEDQAIGMSTEVATSTSTPLKTPASRRLQMPSSTDVLSHQVDDDDSGCFLLTPPSSFSKKVSLWLPVAKLKKDSYFFSLKRRLTMR